MVTATQQGRGPVKLLIGLHELLRVKRLGIAFHVHVAPNAFLAQESVEGGRGVGAPDASQGGRHRPDVAETTGPVDAVVEFSDEGGNGSLVSGPPRSHMTESASETERKASH